MIVARDRWADFDERYFRRKMKWLAKLTPEELDHYGLSPIYPQRAVFMNPRWHDFPIFERDADDPFGFRFWDHKIIGYKRHLIMYNSKWEADYSTKMCMFWGRDPVDMAYWKSDHPRNRINNAFFEFWSKRQKNAIREKENAIREKENAKWREARRKVECRKYESKHASRMTEAVFWAGAAR